MDFLCDCRTGRVRSVRPLLMTAIKRGFAAEANPLFWLGEQGDHERLLGM